MKLGNIKHIFISDLPPLCCWGQAKLSCPWKPSNSVVCCRGTILLTISSPAHSRPAILLTGLFRVKKLQFCHGNSMRCCGLVTGQTSKKQVDHRGQIKGYMHNMHKFISLLVVLKLTILNLNLQPYPHSSKKKKKIASLFFAIKETLRKSLALTAWFWALLSVKERPSQWHHQVPTTAMMYMLFRPLCCRCKNEIFWIQYWLNNRRRC